MVVVIFEGIQGVGKTSLISELERLGVVTNAKFPRPIIMSNVDYATINRLSTEVAKNRIIELAKSNKVYAIDRYIASEFVFGKICNRKDDYQWLWCIDKELGQQFNKFRHSVFTVYVTAPWQFCVDNIWKRRSTYTAELMIAKLSAAARLYSEYLENSVIPVIMINNNPTDGVTASAKLLWDKIKVATKVEAELKGD